jgi:Zn-dependent protease
MSTSNSPEPDDEELVEQELDSAPNDAWTEDVFRHLEQLQSGQRSWGHSLLILVSSLLLFGAAHLVQNSPENLAWLVAVLLIHESGHFLGMKMFGYRDVKMFFLPFFGAAVSGRSHHVPGWQAAIVILLGPLPGIAIGILLGIFALAFPNETLRTTALLFTAVNGFNLLPFMPLDGGRLLQLTLFGRQRHLEALFQGLTGLLLALLGFATGGWMLGAVGILMLIGSGHVFRVSTVAQKTLAEAGDEWRAREDFERIPTRIARRILHSVRIQFPQIKKPKMAATTIKQVWDRMHVNPPSAAATLAVLCVHAVGFISMFVMCGVLVLAGPKPAPAGPAPAGQAPAGSAPVGVAPPRQVAAQPNLVPISRPETSHDLVVRSPNS